MRPRGGFWGERWDWGDCSGEGAWWELYQSDSILFVVTGDTLEATQIELPLYLFIDFSSFLSDTWTKTSLCFSLNSYFVNLAFCSFLHWGLKRITGGSTLGSELPVQAPPDLLCCEGADRAVPVPVPGCYSQPPQALLLEESEDRSPCTSAHLYVFQGLRDEPFCVWNFTFLWNF